MSVTYGAMGNTQANTLRVVTEIQNRIGIETAAHLTCVAHSRDEIAGILGKLAEAHIENIVALRDPPQGNGIPARSRRIPLCLGAGQFYPFPPCLRPGL